MAEKKVQESAEPEVKTLEAVPDVNELMARMDQLEKALAAAMAAPTAAGMAAAGEQMKRATLSPEQIEKFQPLIDELHARPGFIKARIESVKLSVVEEALDLGIITQEYNGKFRLAPFKVSR